jgi:hypothetical protein
MSGVGGPLDGKIQYKPVADAICNMWYKVDRIKSQGRFNRAAVQIAGRTSP